MPYIVSDEYKQQMAPLCVALAACAGDVGLMTLFFRDLLSEDEARDISLRWQIAQLLLQGLTQRDVATRCHVAVKTVTEVNKWVSEKKNGTGGFRQVYERLPPP